MLSHRFTQTPLTVSAVSFAFPFTVYPSAKFPTLFETVAFIVNLWLL